MPKLCIFVTHPVQYHVPLWRALAAQPQLQVKVFYFSDRSVRGGRDVGFGIDLKWDVDLLSGYDYEFLSTDADLEHPQRVRIRDARTLLRRERPDWTLVSGYTHRFEQQLIVAAPLSRSRLVMRGEFSDLSEHKRTMIKSAVRSAYLRAFYSRVSTFCYPGQLAREHLLAHGVHPDRTFFSPYSVDDSLIVRAKATTDRASARKQLGIADDLFMFLFSGKLIPRKDPLALLRAIRQLPEIRRVGLIALGDGELREQFVAQARELLGPRFVFPGFVNQSELGRYFLAADALVIPSRHETWGLVVNEAMHYGLPVIASDRTGCHPDLIIPGQTGWVYPQDRPESLIELMTRLMSEPSAARRMGEAAARHVESYTIAASARGVARALALTAPEAH